jgi:hypothetical protein
MKRSPPPITALAGWQQALGNREQHDAALLSAYEQLNEYQLRDIVRRHLAPWERSEGPTPGAIDPELFVALKALFAKANDPRDHVYHVRQFYEASRDFRLLAALTDAVIGQSAQKVYPFLEELRTTLDEIDREAADELLIWPRFGSRQNARRSALDLLDCSWHAGPRKSSISGAACERRRGSSGQKNEWSQGELPQMAGCSASWDGYRSHRWRRKRRMLDRLYAATQKIP